MLGEISSSINTLSRAEKAVARWVLEHPQQTTNATIADVAAAAGTSQPTVVRFCRSLGVDGFRNFKLRLAAAIRRPESLAHQDVSSDDSIDVVASKVIDQSIRALDDIRLQLPGLPLRPIVEAMSGARQIVFAGLGASGQVARDAVQKFFRLGIPCASATDSPTFLQMAAIAEPTDVFMTVSHSGRRKDVVLPSRRARERGATVITLTDPSSPLAAEATIVLGARADEDTNVYTPMRSRLVQLALLDALQVALAVQLGSIAEERLRLTKKALLPG